MHNKNLKKYFFINKFDYSHFIDLDENITFIWRNKDKEVNLDSISKFKKFCKKNNWKFFICNNVKLAIKMRANGVYLSSYNKNLSLNMTNFKKNFRIIGSAHNYKEIYQKQKQKLDEIFLSPIFKKKNNPKLEIYKYLNLKKMIKVKDIALGGINKQNIKRLKLVNSFGFAGIEYFEQKKRPLKY